MMEGSVAGSVRVTSGSGCGYGRPKNIRIRIPNTEKFLCWWNLTQSTGNAPAHVFISRWKSKLCYKNPLADMNKRRLVFVTFDVWKRHIHPVLRMSGCLLFTFFYGCSHGSDNAFELQISVKWSNKLVEHQGSSFYDQRTKFCPRRGIRIYILPICSMAKSDTLTKWIASQLRLCFLQCPVNDVLTPDERNLFLPRARICKLLLRSPGIDSASLCSLSRHL